MTQIWSEYIFIDSKLTINTFRGSMITAYGSNIVFRDSSVDGNEVREQSQVRKGMSAGEYCNLTGSDKYIQYDPVMMGWAGSGIGEINCMRTEREGASVEGNCAPNVTRKAKRVEPGSVVAPLVLQASSRGHACLLNTFPSY